MKRSYRVFGSVTAAGVLAAAAACSKGGGDVSAASTAPALSADRVVTAPITAGELGARWADTQGGATWRDGLLKARTNVADCQKLLDGLYAEDLLGEPSGARAVAGFDDSGIAAQLRYQVGAYGRAAVDAKLAWLKTLPAKCEQFMAIDDKGGKQAVEVAPASLPGVGDAREGLRMTMTGALDGAASRLTLDFAAVRVGDTAIAVTNGGLGGVEGDFTRQAVQVGTQRLQDVLAGRKPVERHAAQQPQPQQSEQQSQQQSQQQPQQPQEQGQQSQSWSQDQRQSQDYDDDYW